MRRLTELLGMPQKPTQQLMQSLAGFLRSGSIPRAAKSARASLHASSITAKASRSRSPGMWAVARMPHLSSAHVTRFVWSRYSTAGLMYQARPWKGSAPTSPWMSAGVASLSTYTRSGSSSVELTGRMSSSAVNTGRPGSGISASAE